MNTILTWLVTTLLNWLMGRVVSAVERYADKVALDKQRGITDEANIKAHAEAKDRAEKIKAASDLLNSAHTP